MSESRPPQKPSPPLPANMTEPLSPSEAETWINRIYRGSVLLTVILSLVYTLSPVDVIPDVLIGAGQIDDLAVLLSGGGAIGTLTLLRTIFSGIMKRPNLRTGCLIVVGVGSIVFIAVAILAFYGLYTLIESF